jgi:hypothetical protein
MLYNQRVFLKERRIYEQRDGGVKGVRMIFPVLSSTRSDSKTLPFGLEPPFLAVGDFLDAFGPWQILRHGAT